MCVIHSMYVRDDVIFDSAELLIMGEFFGGFNSLPLDIAGKFANFPRLSRRLDDRQAVLCFRSSLLFHMTHISTSQRRGQ